MVDKLEENLTRQSSASALHKVAPASAADAILENETEELEPDEPHLSLSISCKSNS